MRHRWLPATGIAMVLAFGGNAAADARVEARRHFKTGMALIAEGQYDEGVAELLQAYSVRPHPSVLFNIAKACESSGRMADALSYYRRYLEANPPDAADVLKLVERLEARLPRKPEPPSAPPAQERAAVEPPPHIETKAAEPAPAPWSAEEARRATERSEKASARPEHSPERLPERTSQRAPDRASPRPPEPPPEPDTSAVHEPAAFSAPYEETVVAASRRVQSALEAPNAITVISGDEIRASGLTSLPEILRRVPGAEVMAMDYSSSDVSFRGFNQRISNKVLVLIDGRPEYQDFLGLTMWSTLTIGPEEIERIEVIRGPGSALYGANAMVGVINIITRAPGTGPQAQFTALGGNGGVGSASAVLSGGERLRYRVSGGYSQGDKYTRDYADDRADVASSVSDPNLSLRSGRANATLFFAFDPEHSVALTGGVNRIYSEVYASGLLRNFIFDGVAGSAKLDVSAAPVKLRLFWNAVSVDASPQYEPIGQRSQAMKVDSHVLDGELFFQKSFELGGAHALASGVSTRLKNIKWTYVGPTRQELHGAGFLQDEWRPVRALSLLASYRVDGHPLLDGGKPGFAHSPRFSAVVSPSEGQALRFSFATAFRAPTFLESYLYLRTPISGINGASILTEGNISLRPERLTSFEVGYRGEAARLGISWDLALYWNIVKDMIGFSAVTAIDAPHAIDAATGTYLYGRSQFVNDSQTYTARGGEAGVTWNALEGLDLRASMAVQSVTSDGQAEACGPCTEAPALKLNGGATYRSPVGLDLSADVTYVSSTTWIERQPAAQDPARVLNLQNPLSSYVVVNARVAYRFFDDRITVSVVGSDLGPDHQEHPFGNKINRRIFAVLSVQP
jgi:outer membrane receptor protein involved in Fe transport